MSDEVSPTDSLPPPPSESALPQSSLLNRSEKSYYDIRIDVITVTLSPKFQVVIPPAVRERFGLSAGEKLRVLPYKDRIELIPVRPIKSMRGFLKGMDTTLPREDDRL